MREFRARFGIPISDEDIAEAPFHKLPDHSPEMQYLQQRRQELGGYVPRRMVKCRPLTAPGEELFEEFYDGTGDREMATTMILVRLLSKLLHDPAIGKLIVPIVPDEARTFGMETLFRQVGIYAHTGQLYEPVDKETLLYYRETQDGQILEEGISEAGSISSFIAAGTSYATQCINSIPFFLFYSMFGFQRIGDLIWAAADSRCRGFLVGGTAGRTTLAGEGLQHQDGHSHLLAYPVPNLLCYDPAFGYEIAVIVREGIRRMYEAQESVFYYLTVMNEFYPMPPMPAGEVRDGILKGMYKYQASEPKADSAGPSFSAAAPSCAKRLRARTILEERYDVAADVWSVTSYKELYRDGHDAEHWNLLHPLEQPRVPYVTARLADEPGVLVAASDYVKALPDSISRWMPRPLVSLGTDGFGRSDTREALRDFFEVDARFITLATLSALARAGEIQPDVVRKAMVDLEIDPDKANPMMA